MNKNKIAKANRRYDIIKENVKKFKLTLSVLETEGRYRYLLKALDQSERSFGTVRGLETFLITLDLINCKEVRLTPTGECTSLATAD